MNTEGKVTYKYIVYIQFEESKKAYTFGSDVKYYTNDVVVVETVRGQELGKVCVPTVDFDASKVKGDIKPVLRKATQEDIKFNRLRIYIGSYKSHFYICVGRSC